MAGTYPTIVRKFQNHADGTDYVMAGHMNAAQDEITAIQSTLGTKPNTFTRTSGPPITYTNVASRLDVVQNNQDAHAKQITGLMDASQNGWALPILSVYASGTPIPPSPISNPIAKRWYRLTWTQSIFDTHGAYQYGQFLTIPKTGWWMISCNTTMQQPVTDPNIDHTVYMRIQVQGAVAPVWYIAQAGSNSTADRVLWHRMSATAQSDFYAGDQVFVDVAHYYRRISGSDPYQQDTLTAQARLQMTYIRALPTGSTARANAPLPDETE